MGTIPLREERIDETFGEMLGASQGGAQTVACAIKLHNGCKGRAEGDIRCSCMCHYSATITDLFDDFLGQKGP